MQQDRRLSQTYALGLQRNSAINTNPPDKAIIYCVASLQPCHAAL